MRVLVHAHRNIPRCLARRPPPLAGAGPRPQHGPEARLAGRDRSAQRRRPRHVEIMRRTGKSKTCVWRWQERFAEEGCRRPPARQDPAPAHPAARGRGGGTGGRADPERPAARGDPLDRPTLAPPESASSVQRIWHAHGLKPHLVALQTHDDPQFVEKLRDIVGLYLNPPQQAIVLSVDEKSQIQALDRTQPSLPMKKGRGDHDPRLQASRNDHVVRGPQRPRAFTR